MVPIRTFCRSWRSWVNLTVRGFSASRLKFGESLRDAIEVFWTYHCCLRHIQVFWRVPTSRSKTVGCFLNHRITHKFLIPHPQIPQFCDVTPRQQAWTIWGNWWSWRYMAWSLRTLPPERMWQRGQCATVQICCWVVTPLWLAQQNQLSRLKSINLHRKMLLPRSLCCTCWPLLIWWGGSPSWCLPSRVPRLLKKGMDRVLSCKHVHCLLYSLLTVLASSQRFGSMHGGDCNEGLNGLCFLQDCCWFFST